MAGTIGNVNILDGTLKYMINEKIGQTFDLFNEKSGGALILNGQSFEGDYETDIFIKDITALATSRRDINSTGTITPADYNEFTHVKVKLAGNFYVAIPNAVLAWSVSGDKPNAQISAALEALAQQYANAYLQDQFNTSVAALCSAIGSNAAMIVDYAATAGETIDQVKIEEAKDKFGDKVGLVETLLVHSGAKSQLMIDAITNANSLDTVGGVAINQGIVQAGGLRIIMSDCPSLKYHDGTRDVYRSLFLTNGASKVSQVSQIEASHISQGKENITSTWQSNYVFDVDVKGYSWDTGTGGNSPTDVAIATSVNWEQDVTDDKYTAGSALITPLV